MKECKKSVNIARNYGIWRSFGNEIHGLQKTNARN